jgi:hypothetical protein
LEDLASAVFLLTAQALSGTVEDALFPANGMILMKNQHGAGQKKAPGSGTHPNMHRERIPRSLLRG